VKKFIISFFLFLSCENKYKSKEDSNQTNQEEVPSEQDGTVNINGKTYKISGTINLELQE
jgi:archaellum component FlaF (FlaF/FlaG flagellin family)